MKTKEEELLRKVNAGLTLLSIEAKDNICATDLKGYHRAIMDAKMLVTRVLRETGYE